jgi:Tol biopolymer transport system component
VYQLATAMGPVTALAWSPDSRRVAFVAGTTESHALYLVDASCLCVQQPQRWIDLSDALPPQDYTQVSRLVWSPDGRWISLERYSPDPIYLIDMAVPGIRAITVGQLAGWSPDSTRLIYQRRDDQEEELYTYNIETGEERRLTDNPSGNTLPVWSPDGEEIAFVRTQPGGSGMSVREIAVMDSDGDNLRVLSSTSFTVITGLDWSPDGTRIAFTSQDVANEGLETSEDLYVVNANGSGLHHVVDGPPPNISSTPSHYYSLAWQP